MKHVYVANYQTAENLAAEQDDPSVKNELLVDFAAPQLSRVFLKWDSKALAAVRQDVQKEFDELYSDIDAQHGDGDESSKPVLRWVEGEFETPEFGYENAVHYAYDAADPEDEADPLAIVVVQKRPVG